jgi:hypothetical protein
MPDAGQIYSDIEAPLKSLGSSVMRLLLVEDEEKRQPISAVRWVSPDLRSISLPMALKAFITRWSSTTTPSSWM